MTRLTVEQVPLGDLRHYPGNARRGDVDTIAASLQRFGQYRPLVVQRSTSHVIAGNHTLQAAQRLGWPSVQVTYLDVDDDTARRILIADNRTADLGGYDDQALGDLLRELGEDYTGTGWAEEDVEELLTSLEAEPPTVLTPAGPEPTRPRATPDRPEYEESYSSRATRFMPLNYPLAQYTWLTARLTGITAEEGVSNYAEAILRLVEHRVGEEAPPLEDGQVMDGPGPTLEEATT